MIEQLEDRTLLAVASFPWLQDIEFNQFTGGAPIVFGFGVTDNTIAGANVSAAPKFIGLDTSSGINWGNGFSDPIFGTHTGVSVYGTYSIRVGIEYGFYVNAGTATLLHDGAVNFTVAPPATNDGPTTIQTSVSTANGLVYTQSPTISAYADLVLKFNLNVAASAEVADSSLGSIPVNFNIDKKFDLFSINRQEKEANGAFKTNPDGSPALNGEIKYALITFIDGIKKAGEKLSEAVKKVQKAKADKAAAELEKGQARTPAERQKAESDSATADAAKSEGEQEKTALDNESAKKKSFLSRLGLTVGFSQADEGTLGARATLSAGEATGPVSFGKTLGSMTVTLPSIGLTGQQDASGKIIASTNTFAKGSPEDLKRNLATLTIDPLALVGLGEQTVSVGPLSASLTKASYNITAALAVNQTVQSQASSYPVTMVFADAITGDPVTVTPMVNGLLGAPATSVTYDAGQLVKIYPPQNFNDQIIVTAAVNPVYSFSNTIGLDVGVTGTITLLKGTIDAPGLGPHSLGPLFTHPNTILDPQDLGNIYTKTFTVTSPTPEALGSFTIGPSADVAVSIVSGPPSTIAYSNFNTHPPVDYTVRVTNNGPSDATGILLTDILPSQILVNEAFSTSGVVVNHGLPEEAVYSIDTLAPGQSVDVTIAGYYNSGPGGRISSSFGVISDQSDPNRSNNNLQGSTLLLAPTIYDVSTETGLRNAIAEVNNTANPDFTPIIFLAPQQTIHLAQGELDITRSVVISTRSGDRALINGGGLSRIFNFTGDAQQSYELENLNLFNGNGDSNGYGGAINLGQGGTLAIQNSIIHDNTALTGGGAGGGIYAAVGTLNLDDVEFSNNQAIFGGALYLAGEATTLTDVRMYDNSATDSGSAIHQFSTTNHAASTTIRDSVVFNNQGQSGGASINNALGSSRSSTVTYERSAFSTTAIGTPSAPPNFNDDADATTILTSLGDNIASDNTGNLTATGDRPNTLAGLFLSGPHQIASGHAGFVIGGLSLVWPGVNGAVNFDVSQDDQFLVTGNILRLHDDQTYNSNTTHLVTVSIRALDESNNGVGPNNTNFLLEVVQLNEAPTSITVTSPDGIDEATSTTNEPGVLIGSVTVDDPNVDTAFTFDVDDARFQIIGDGTSGYNLYLAPGQLLAYLQAASIPIQVTATDPGGLSVTSPYTVVVNRVQQAPTHINLSGIFIKPRVAGAVVGQLQAYSPNDDPSAPITPGEYTYSVSDTRFEVVNGVLQLKSGQMVQHSASPIPLQVTATDGTGLFLVQTFDLVEQTPIIIGITTDTGTSASDGITSDPRLLIRGSSEQNMTITVSHYGSVIGTTTADATGAWTLDYSGVILRDGIYSTTAIASDTLGNSSNPSSPFQITVDTAAPIVSATATPTSAGFDEVHFTFTGAVAGFALSSLSMALGGVPVSLADAFLTNSDDGTNWTLGGLSANTQQAGTYRVTVAPAGITDTAGNALPAPAPFFNVVVAPPDTTPPTFQLTPPAILTRKSTKDYAFKVVYADASKVKLTSLGNQNLKITGPHNFAAFATKGKVVPSADGTSVTVTYTVTAPTGGWAKSKSGKYTIKLQANQVADLLNNRRGVTATLGTFTVKIA
jgi:uncharacterized repeat protein (TIGR01451 family)